MAVHFFSCGACMNRSAGAAAKLSESDRKHLGVQALAGSDTISALADQLDVRRKFVCAQAHEADLALDDVFAPAAPDDEVLFHLPVTRTWLRQATLALTLTCRSSYRGVVEFIRDLLGVSVSVGAVHNLQHWPPAQPVVAHAPSTYSQPFRVFSHNIS